MESRAKSKKEGSFVMASFTVDRINRFIRTHCVQDNLVAAILKLPFRKLRNKLRKPMRLGVSYNLYDGEELLEYSIKSIRSAVEYICVVYQDISNSGEVRKDSVLTLLQYLKMNGLIDEIVLYTPNLSKNREENELCKRMQGLAACKKAKCTHFLDMDVDEFYRHDEFVKAKKWCLDNNMDVSAVSIIEYVKSPRWRLVSNYMNPPDNENYTFYVPFICRIRGLCWDYPFPCLVDPTRGLLRVGRFYLFEKHMIAMHHMSTVRKDLMCKYRNSTLSEGGRPIRSERIVLEYKFHSASQLPQGYDIIGTYLVKDVPNEFGVPYWT